MNIHELTPEEREDQIFQILDSLTKIDNGNYYHYSHIETESSGKLLFVGGDLLSFLAELSSRYGYLESQDFSFRINPQGRVKHSHTNAKKLQQEREVALKAQIAEVNTNQIATLKAAKTAHDDTINHYPKVRKLMTWTIIVASISGATTVVSLINAISSQRAQKSTQSILMRALEQQQLKDSSIQSLVNVNTHLLDLLLKGSSKKIFDSVATAKFDSGKAESGLTK